MRLPGELISHICHIEYGEMSIAPGIRSPRLIGAIKESTPPPVILFIVLFHSVLFLRLNIYNILILGILYLPRHPFTPRFSPWGVDIRLIRGQRQNQAAVIRLSF